MTPHRRRGAETTSEAEALLRLRGVLDQLPAAVAVLRGPTHVFEFANTTFAELFGRPDVEGRTVLEVFPEAADQGFIDLLDSVLRTGEPVVGSEVPAVIITDEGPQEMFIDQTYQPFHDGGGTIEGILVHGVDVTLAVRAREQLDQALRREQEDRFRQAIDSMIDTVVIAAPVRDEDGDVVDFAATFVNSGSDEVGRRRSDELVGRRFTTLWPNVAASGLLGRYRTVCVTGEPMILEGFAYDDLVEDRPVGGSFDIRATRLGDDLFLVFRDVTDRVQREKALAESRARLAQEHEVVASLQSALLPREIPFVPGIEIAAEYVAASEHLEVGGDWFDVFRTPSGAIALAIGDVAGKGLEAAHVMGQLRTAGRVAALAAGDPTDVLQAQNRLMLTVGLGPFATSIFALYDPGTGELTWSSAGHLPPLLVHGDASRFLDAPPRPPLGVAELPEYVQQSTRLRPGERLVLFTDGLVERRNESLADGLERLRRVAAGFGTTQEACRDLLDCLGVTASRADDVCVLALDRTPEPVP